MMSSLYQTSLFVLLLTVSVFGNSCPHSEDIYPCLCKSFNHIPSLLDVACKHTTLTELQNAFVGLRGKTIRSLFISNLEVDKPIPSDLFSGLHVETMTVSLSQLLESSDGSEVTPFKGLENSLKELTMEGCISIADLNLYHLKQLSSLTLSNNEIPEIGTNFYKLPIGLRELLVVECKVKNVKNRSLARLANLEYLDFTSNQISTFSRNILPKLAGKLKFLLLLDNKLSTLPDDAFSGMPMLDQIDLRGNNIRELTSATWSPVWEQVRDVKLDWNPIDCKSGIDWMFEKRTPKRLSGSCDAADGDESKELRNVIERNRKNSPASLHL